MWASGNRPTMCPETSSQWGEEGQKRRNHRRFSKCRLDPLERTMKPLVSIAVELLCQLWLVPRSWSRDLRTFPAKAPRLTWMERYWKARALFDFWQFLRCRKMYSELIDGRKHSEISAWNIMKLQYTGESWVISFLWYARLGEEPAFDKPCAAGSEKPQPQAKCLGSALLRVIGNDNYCSTVCDV
jgi:hypothetical protein